MNIERLKIFSGRSNPALAQKIADYLGIPLGNCTIRTFSDGELYVKFEENVREQDVYLVQSTNSPAENILELVLMVDAAIRASAHRVTVVIPYFGYGRQDRKDTPRVPVSSRVMVDMYTAMGANRIISMDMHSTQIQGFAKIPFDHLYARKVLQEEILNLGLNPAETVVLSPDIGSAQMSQSYAKRMGMHFALVDKRRFAPNQTEIMHVIGKLKDKHVLIIDDMIDTAGTIVNASSKALEMGARDVYAIATHGVLSGPAVERLTEAPINRVIVTDTIDIPKEKQFPKLKIATISGVFGEALGRINSGESVSQLFEFQ